MRLPGGPGAGGVAATDGGTGGVAAPKPETPDLWAAALELAVGKQETAGPGSAPQSPPSKASKRSGSKASRCWDMEVRPSSAGLTA